MTTRDPSSWFARQSPNSSIGDLVRVTQFWNTVDKRGTNECWPWMGYSERGYGKFYWHGRLFGAHELAVTFTTGEMRLPELDTCHSCDNPICCNPSHLRFDTRISNVTDSVQRGRMRGNPKLTDQDVVNIRKRIAEGARQQDIADQYGVSQSAVSAIKKYKRRAGVA